MRGKEWDLDAKIAAAMAYAITGNASDASKMCEIPVRTIADWKDTEWFTALVEECQEAKQKELNARWTGLIHKATDVIEKILTEGEDVVIGKGDTKTVVKIKPSLKDVAQALGVLSEKRSKLREQIAKKAPAAKPTQERLDGIRKRLGEDPVVSNGKTSSDESN
jgi:hypothetical protein